MLTLGTQQDLCKTWGTLPQYSGCALNKTWTEINQHLRNNHDWATQGGLGDLRERGRVGTWLCVKQHACSVSGDVPHFCFVYNEVARTFIPWDTAQNLGLTYLCPARR